MLEINISKRVEGFTLNISLAAMPGQVLGLLGASGCGKSMTLRCIAGIEKPDSGSIMLNGETLFDSERRINVPPQKRRIGYLFQNYALFPNMTALQNVAVAVKRETAKNKRQTAMNLLGQMRLGEALGKYPHELSGGMRQRVALARLLASEPRMLLLDEPFSALDDFLRWRTELELSDFLKNFEGEIIFVSHSRNEVYRVCDEVCVIADGRGSAVRPVAELFAAPRTVSAALISGCKNFSRVTRGNDGVLLAEDWGNARITGVDCGDDTGFIGVHAHNIKPVLLKSSESPESTAKTKNSAKADNAAKTASSAKTENSLRCVAERVITDTFGVIVMLKTEGEGERSAIRMDLTNNELARLRDKTSFAESSVLDVYINAKDIMPLGGE